MNHSDGRKYRKFYVPVGRLAAGGKVGGAGRRRVVQICTTLWPAGPTSGRPIANLDVDRHDQPILVSYELKRHDYSSAHGNGKGEFLFWLLDLPRVPATGMTATIDGQVG